MSPCRLWWGASLPWFTPWCPTDEGRALYTNSHKRVPALAFLGCISAIKATSFWAPHHAPFPCSQRCRRLDQGQSRPYLVHQMSSGGTQTSWVTHTPFICLEVGIEYVLNLAFLERCKVFTLVHATQKLTALRPSCLIGLLVRVIVVVRYRLELLARVPTQGTSYRERWSAMDFTLFPRYNSSSSTFHLFSPRPWSFFCSSRGYHSGLRSLQ
jgi:hypothetical protein